MQSVYILHKNKNANGYPVAYLTMTNMLPDNQHSNQLFCLWKALTAKNFLAISGLEEATQTVNNYLHANIW